MRTVWLAQENADLTEGRGPMVTKGAFFCKEDAERAAANLKRVYGFGHGEVAREPLEVWNSFEEWQQHNDNAVRSRALAKLTPEEREALGFAGAE